MRQLTKDYLAIWVTLIALTSQLFFGVVHATALWSASAGSVAQFEQSVATNPFLQICTAGGILSVDGSQEGEDQCPVCSSEATSSMMDAAGAEILCSQQHHTVFLAAPADQLIAHGSEQRVFIRGPPAFS